MINTHDSKLGQSVKMTELYDYLDLTPSYYNRWVEKELWNNPYFIENQDFCTSVQVFGVGRKRQEYDVHIDSAKKLCMVSRSKKGNEIRDELVRLTKKVENKDLLSEYEILTLSSLIGFFKYVENQVDICKINSDNYVSKHPSKYAYAEFHTLRNKMLGISKQELEVKLKSYCAEHKLRLPRLTSSADKIRFIDSYDSLKNAVWDFLYVNGSPTAIKMAELAKKMAKAQGLQIFEKNEDNLFQTKEHLMQLQLKQNTSYKLCNA
jgi:phage anti-repressor protein